jgi:hypothetical protein
MNFDTPLVEYLIIGMHTSTWLSLIYLKLLKLPMATLLKVDATLLLLLLPFIYIIGMIFDDITFRLLSPRISKIKRMYLGRRVIKMRISLINLRFCTMRMKQGYEEYAS